ncbi:MAG: tRNA epoxyqueuosine(34) reductase QueG [Crocinitomicaceae bacterium]|jgi:epoxyqueuosine reductase|nr:tRNA epoxyqueuosine(34) reductase QueG [Crocinitomicaceae bacterium]MDC1385372.1 tRNA epoxyqueuosine(34) reductase QueG [Crocinitomicaceae bacterium]|tara:strand:- start:493 stop:1422 length:930 start_codon:yes stop_codon:yes gene_type:complete
MNLKEIYTQKIKRKAKELGFFFCGISNADFLAEEAKQLDNWLKLGYHGKMNYMENHYDKRLDPRLLVDDAKSVVSLLLNYYTEDEQTDPKAPKISKYAYGKDYHFIIKDKLKEFYQFIQDEIGEVGGRVFVDSAPVMDKAWAKKSGLGWMGKNANIINPKHGSFFFIAEMILDLELEPDGPIKDYCGTCTQCIDECPTDAIVEPYVIDGSKCISYLTIELKDEIMPSEFKGKMDNWMFGCDICQSVCPWNRFSKPHSEPWFNPHEDLLKMSKHDWDDLTEEVFQELFRKSAVKRTKFPGLIRNISSLKE